MQPGLFDDVDGVGVSSSSPLDAVQPAVELAGSFGRVIHVGRRRHAPHIYVGRSFAGRVDVGFGNPFRMRTDTAASRVDAIAGFWSWLHSDDGDAAVVLDRVARGELGGVLLGCWCAPEPCHGHLLAAVADGHADAAGVWVQDLVAAVR